MRTLIGNGMTLILLGAMTIFPDVTLAQPAAAPTTDQVIRQDVDLRSETNDLATPAEIRASQSQEPDEMIQQMLDDFLKRNSLVEGRNPNKKNKHIYTAIQVIDKPVTHPDFAKFRITAYDRAYEKALDSFVRAQGVRTATRISSSFLSDNSSDAKTFEQELSSGRSSIAALVDKAIALGDAKLNALLQELGVDPSQYDASAPDQKKVLLRRTFTKHIMDEVSKSLGGVTVAQTFFAEAESGYAAVGIVLCYSPSIEGVAEAFRSGQKPAIAQTGRPLHEILPLDDPAKLYDMLGTRLLLDENGPVVVAFGQWANSYQGSSKSLLAEYRNAAYAQADSNANSELSSFLNQSFTAKTETEQGDLLEEAIVRSGETGMTAENESGAIRDVIRSAAQRTTSAYLTGAVKIKQWKYVTPQGHEVVGVVKAYSFASMEEAKKTFKKDTPEPQQKAPVDLNPSAREGSVTMDFDTF